MISNNKINSFTDLIVWQKAHELIVLIYQLTNNFPKSETYSLIDQMRRSASSTTSNIAEEFGRVSYKEKLKYYYQAHESLTELHDQILIAKDVGYLPFHNYQKFKELFISIQKLLQTFIRSTKKHL